VASNSIRETVIAALTKLDLIDLVDLVVSNEDVKNPKPHPEMYWKCMTHFGKIPAKTLIIEDSSVGLAAAYASGAMVLKVNRPMDITLALLEESVNKSL
jgi:HAD superfamily hydrolase (TIGR01509 family)